MSAYAYDPRVTARPDGTFDVNNGATAQCVCPGLFGGYVLHTSGVDDAEGWGFATADEAIRSLIGEPK